MHDAEQKQRIRSEVRARRAAMSQADRSRAAESLTERLIGLVQDRGARTVTCYAPLPDEPDTTGFLTWALANAVEVLLPVSLPGMRLEWARHVAKDPAPGRHGILEPQGERLPGSAAADADLMLIPACAVDPLGTRLGWGLGYFDRCLADLARRPPVFAVVFDEDLLPELPAEPHDAPVSGVVTPGGVRVFHEPGPEPGTPPRAATG